MFAHKIYKKKGIVTRYALLKHEIPIHIYSNVMVKDKAFAARQTEQKLHIPQLSKFWDM